MNQDDDATYRICELVSYMLLYEKFCALILKIICAYVVQKCEFLAHIMPTLSTHHIKVQSSSDSLLTAPHRSHSKWQN